MVDVADDRLAARVDMHMLDRDVLLALAPLPRQGFDLHGEGAHEFGCQVAEHVQPFNAVALILMASDAATCTGDELEPQRRHELRIRAKKLRYASEFFAGAFPGKKSSRRREEFVAGLEKL
jgi:CHAD domain-containing protein